MKLTALSRGYWEISVKCNASDPLILRNYDLLKDREKGKTLGELAIKYGISRMQVCNIINKHK